MDTTKMLNEIYRDYKGMGRKPNISVDRMVYVLVHGLCARGEVDFYMARWLWVEYLEKGILDIKTAIDETEEQKKYAKDIEQTNQELLHWLTKGVY